MPVTEQLAEYSASTSYRDIPPAAVFRTKCVLLDELSCMVLGKRLPPGALLARYVEELGGAPQATVLGHRLRAPAPMAALANGTAGHADELDGSHLTEGHPGASIVAACIAVAEKVQASGAELINAVALGYDLATRLVDVVGGRSHLLQTRHLHSDFLHSFGAAAACGRLLQLPPDKHRHAAALTACQAISLAAFFEEREHMSKSFTYGHGAYAGVTAALLADLGLEGNDDVFGATHGVLNAWDARDRAALLLEGLGKDFAILDTNFKFYSAGYPIHAPLEATLGLMADHGLHSSDISSINVRTTTACAEVVNARAMPTICLQDMLPVGMLFQRLGFAEAHDAEHLGHPEVKRLRDAITLEVDPDMDRANPRGRGAFVTLATNDARELTRSVEWPQGHCRAGEVAWDALVDKSHEMIDDEIGAEQVDRFAGLVEQLETVEDVRDVTRMLVPGISSRA